MIKTDLISERVGQIFPQLREYHTMLDELRARCPHSFAKVIQKEDGPFCNNCGRDPRGTHVFSPYRLSEAEVANGEGTRNRLGAVIEALEAELQSLQAQCPHPEKHEYLDDMWCSVCRKNWDEVMKEKATGAVCA